MAGYDADVFGSSPGPSAFDPDVFPRVKAETAAPTSQAPTTFPGNLEFATPFGNIRTPIPMPEAVNKRLAQLGSGFADWGLAARQMLASDKPSLSSLVTGESQADKLRREADAKRAIDASLNSDLAGKVLNFAGKAAPSMAVPQIAGAPILSGVMAGAISGAFDPVGQGESRASKTALGAGLGGLIPGAVGLASRAVRPDQATAELARTAGQYGIPVAPADLSSNGLVRGLRSMTNDMPIIGMPGQALRAEQQSALNKAVGGTFGASAQKLTPDVIDAAKKRMGSEFDRIWSSNSLEVDGTLIQQLQRLQAVAADMPKSEGAAITAKIGDFLSKAQPNANGAPTVSGEAANYFQQWLRQQAAGKQGFQQESINELRKSVLDAFNRSVSPADAAALTLNRGQYKAFKTVEPLLDKGSSGMAGRIEGDIPAALLPGAVQQSYKGLSSQTTQPALADLAKVAGRFLVDRTPQTGGSSRALIQNSAIGAAAGLGGYANPLAAAGGLGGGLLLNSALNSGNLGASLVNKAAPAGLLSSPDASRAMKEAARLLAERSPLGLLSLVPGFSLSALE